MHSSSLFTTLALLVATPMAVLAHPQAQPGQTTTTKSELSITALSRTGQSTTVKFPGIPGLTQNGGIPKCGADTGIDAQKTNANEVFCRTLRAELAKAGGDAWKDVTKEGDVKIVGFTSSQSTSTTDGTSSTSGGQTGGNGNGGSDANTGGNTAAAASSSAAGNFFAVESLVLSVGLVAASGVIIM